MGVCNTGSGWVHWTKGRILMRAWAWILMAALMPGMALAKSSAEPPQRAVSMNLCTDQLAMLVAGDDQLVSVSALSQDPNSSAMADAAAAFPVNHGRAEEIHLFEPDLVIAGRFNAGATVSMLQRLDIPVVVFEPANSLSDVRENLRRMGKVLGQAERAEQLIAAFEGRLAILSATTLNAPAAALYFPNGYTRGEGTLVGDIVRVAGFANVASDYGIRTGAHLSLEQLVMAAPELVITGSRHAGYSRSETIMEHPVLAQAAASGAHRGLVNRDWICGTPHVLAAIERIGALRGELVRRE